MKKYMTYMTLDEFFKLLEKDGIYEDLVVRLSYKYPFEKDSERQMSNEILSPDGEGDWEWLHDWDEGYTGHKESPVYVFGFIKVDDIDIY